MLTASLTRFTKIQMNFAIAIHAAAFQPRVFYLAQQTLIFPSAIRQLVATPCIVTAGVHSHHFAQAAHGIFVHLALNKRVPQSDSLAKYAVAFFNISRSSDTRLSSAFNRRFSA